MDNKERRGAMTEVKRKEDEDTILSVMRKNEVVRQGIKLIKQRDGNAV